MMTINELKKALEEKIKEKDLQAQSLFGTEWQQLHTTDSNMKRARIMHKIKYEY